MVWGRIWDPPPLPKITRTPHHRPKTHHPTLAKKEALAKESKPTKARERERKMAKARAKERRTKAKAKETALQKWKAGPL
jgi:hypothetical protein